MYADEQVSHALGRPSHHPLASPPSHHPLQVTYALGFFTSLADGVADRPDLVWEAAAHLAALTFLEECPTPQLTAATSDAPTSALRLLCSLAVLAHGEPPHRLDCRPIAACLPPDCRLIAT